MRLENISAESWQFIIDREEKLEQGILLWYRGCPYPRRVYHNRVNDPNFFLRTLNALGSVKKYLLTLTFLKDIAFPRTLNIRKYESFLLHLFLVFDWNLREFYIQDKEFSVPVWEMGKFINQFLQNIGLSENTAVNYAKIGMMILEFDCAYRYRAQDIIGETSKELLQNPRKEIKRLFEIYNQREGLLGAQYKINKLNLLLKLLFIPKLKKAFLNALEQIDIEKIKFDKNDRFHTSFWVGYDFEGKNFEQRFSPYEELYKTIPFKKREDPQIINNFLTGL